MPKIRARRTGSRRTDSGYMLLFLMIAVAVATITLLGVARNYRRGIQRDREVEMIHRGEQYARAVQRYYRKYHNYPISIEQLQSSNNLRFLRKKYKDPMSADGEWKLVHSTDIKIKAGGGLTPATGTVAGATANSGDTGGNLNAVNQSSAATQNTGGPNQNMGGISMGTTAAGTTTGTNTLAQGTDPTAVGIGGTGNANAANAVLGGGPLLGVVSKQTTEGIHSFGEKTKYNEWFFIYDPVQDTGKFLLVGPYNPKMFVGKANSGLNNSTKGSSSSGQPTTPNPGSMTTPFASTPSPTTP